MFMDQMWARRYKTVDHGRIFSVYHQHIHLNIVIPDYFDLVNKKFEFTPAFISIRDVEKGKVCQGRHAVYPVRDFNDPSKTLFLIQL